MSSYLDEDDGLRDGEERVETDEDVVLLVLVLLGLTTAVDVELLNTVNRELLGLEGDLVGFGGNLVGELTDTISPGGREENNLAVAGQKSTCT